MEKSVTAKIKFSSRFEGWLPGNQTEDCWSKYREEIESCQTKLTAICFDNYFVGLRFNSSFQRPCKLSQLWLSKCRSSLSEPAI